MIKYLENENDYNTYIKEDIVLVDFYTEWCGPCKMLTNILEEIDYMKILKVDADKFPNLARQFGIMSVPTLYFYKNSEIVKKEIGYKTPEELKAIYQEISAK